MATSLAARECEGLLERPKEDHLLLAQLLALEARDKELCS